MVAEMLQKYIFIFNIFLSKKLCIFLFNQKNIFVLEEFCHSKKTYLHSVKIYFYLRNFCIQTGFFRMKIYIFIQSKKMYSMKFFNS